MDVLWRRSLSRPDLLSHAPFWEEFYNTGQPYDWKPSYEELRQVLHDSLDQVSNCADMVDRPGNLRILQVGCGTSGLAEGLWSDGFRDICNIDLCASAVHGMASRWAFLVSQVEDAAEAEAMRGGMRWLQMDATKLDGLESGSFDLVLEKNTLDCILGIAHRKDSQRGLAALREFYRVLAPGGLFMSVAYVETFAEAERMALLHEGYFREVKSQRLGTGGRGEPLLYMCRK